VREWRNGRRAGFRIRWATVRVQIPPLAPTWASSRLVPNSVDAPTCRSHATHYGTQLDNTCTTRSGFWGSFVTRCTAKSWGPPIPGLITKLLEVTVVLSPGFKTIEPMVRSGGQQPARTSRYGSRLKRKTAPPTLVTLMSNDLFVPKRTSP
jgi:hypothetical protein